MRSTGSYFLFSILTGRAIRFGSFTALSNKAVRRLAATLHGLRSIMVFAEDVLIRVGLVCAMLGSLAVILLGTAVILKSLGHATPGWFSIAVGVLLLIFQKAGVLTFVTLMISGLFRSQPPVTLTSLEQLIDRIEIVTENEPGA